jgi:hypothetical protein
LHAVAYHVHVPHVLHRALADLTGPDTFQSDDGRRCRVRAIDSCVKTTTAELCLGIVKHPTQRKMTLALRPIKSALIKLDLDWLKDSRFDPFHAALSMQLLPQTVQRTLCVS